MDDPTIMTIARWIDPKGILSILRGSLRTIEIMGEEKVKLDSTQFKCGECEAVIPDDFLNESYCPKCDATYCKSHYPHCEWCPLPANDAMIRTAKCPKGHRRGDCNSDGGLRHIKYDDFDVPCPCAYGFYDPENESELVLKESKKGEFDNVTGYEFEERWNCRVCKTRWTIKGREDAELHRSINSRASRKKR